MDLLPEHTAKATLPLTTTSGAVPTMAHATTVKTAKPAPAMVDTETVKPAKPTPAQRIALSTLDQLASDVYFSFLMLFPLSTNSEIRNVYSILKAGLSLTLSEFPFIGGYLVPGEGATGGRCQMQVDEGHPMRFVYRDFTLSDSQADFKYTYDELKQKGFPLSAFDYEKVAPIPFVVKTPKPAVMAIQANFIHGGLILSICTHHKAADAMTVGTVLKVWAKYTTMIDMASTNGPSAAFDNLTPKPMDRTPMSSGLAGVRLNDFPEYFVVDDSSAVCSTQTEVAAVAAPPATEIASPLPLESPSGSRKIKMCIVHIPATRLAHLKAAASPSSPSEGWISTNDAICAFLWRNIARVRARLASIPQPHSPSPQAPLNLGMSVDARRRMVPTLPKDYMGNASFYCCVSSDATTVTSPSTPLAAVAKLVRDAVTRTDSAKMRGIIGLIDSVPRVSDLNIRIHLDPMRGLAVNSWADMGLYGYEWGAGLGRPESIRVPCMTFETGMPACTVLPRRPDGGLEVLVCLEEAAIQMLSEDEVFLNFVEWRGM